MPASSKIRAVELVVGRQHGPLVAYRPSSSAGDGRGILVRGGAAVSFGCEG